MNSQHWYAMAAWSVGGVMLTAGMWAQEADVSRSKGVPQDWSDHNIVFSLDGLAQHPELIYQEPRILHQLMQRFQARGSNVFSEAETEAASTDFDTARHHRDWSLALGKGHVAAEMFPAKWTYDPSAPPDCTNDYVVFGLDTAGATGGQANLVGLNQLYAGSGGYCATGPNVYFADNVTTVAGGKVVTSPVISLDGTKIAFVESLGTASIFHVLTVASGGGITTAATPTMTSLTYSSSNTTTSSPWVDFSDDVVFVADDNGILYKITGVFKGTPTLVTSSPWPITVSSGYRLSSPVFDRALGLLMVGGRNGDLYEVDASTGAVSVLIIGAHGGKGAGVVVPPIVDVTNGTTFAVTGNDGTSAVLVQADIVTLTQLARARIGVGGTSGTAIDIYQPALSNAYYTNPSSGAIYVCGTGTGTDTSPWAYSFGFAGRTMLITAASENQLVTSTSATCTSWTEFFNPNVGANGTDFLFFGLTQGCPGAGGSTGCVASITTTSATLVTAAVDGGPSGIVVDNYSTLGQASSIYLTGEAVDTAYKFTQSGLN